MTTCNPSCLKKLCQWGMVTFEDFMSTPAKVMIWLLKIEFEHHKSCFVGFLGWVVHAMNSIVLRTGPNSRVQPEQRAQKRKRPLQLKLRIRITDYGPDLRGSPAADRAILFLLNRPSLLANKIKKFIPIWTLILSEPCKSKWGGLEKIIEMNILLFFI